MPCPGERDRGHGHGGEAIRGDGLMATATRELQRAKRLMTGNRRRRSSPRGSHVGL